MDTKQAHTIEMPSQSDNIAQLKASILAHQETQCDNPQYNTLEIIAILGGLNEMMTHYLTSDEIELDIDQLIKLKDAINSTSLITSDPNSKIENDAQLVYTFSMEDTYYHHLFEDFVASKLLYWAYHRIGLVCVVALEAIMNIWRLAFWVNEAYYVAKVITYGIMFIYAIMCSLCINKTVFERSIKHFVFWFKTVICIEQAILFCILRYVMLKDYEPEFVKSQVCGDVFIAFTRVLLVINFSAIDGHHATKSIKVAFGIVVSVMFTLYALYYSFLVDKDSRTMVAVGSFEFSILSLYASALRTLTIFLWKQTILMIIKGDKCVSIRHSPRIKWV